MTNEELKAWLEGFCEAIDEVPTKKQWEQVKAKIKALGPSTVINYRELGHYYPTDKYVWPPQKNWWEENNIRYCSGEINSGLSTSGGRG